MEDGGAGRSVVFTDRPGWDGYGGLLLWASYAQRPDVRPPYARPKSWMDDPIYLEVVSQQGPIRYESILRSGLWLPGDFRACFGFPNMATKEEEGIASSGWLLEELRQLREEPPAWGAAPRFERFRRKNRQQPLQEVAEFGLNPSL